MFRLDSLDDVVVEIASDVTVTLRAADPEIISAGRAAVSKVLMNDANAEGTAATFAFSVGILRAAIKGFEGFGNEEGEPIEFSPENVGHLLRNIHVFDKLDNEYVIPIAMREDEKNASAASSDGTSVQETAAQDIADKSADTSGAPMESTSSPEDSKKVKS